MATSKHKMEAFMKREFIKQYTLNRANTVRASIEGEDTAIEAIKAWNIILHEVNNDKNHLWAG